MINTMIQKIEKIQRFPTENVDFARFMKYYLDDCVELEICDGSYLCSFCNVRARAVLSRIFGDIGDIDGFVVNEGRASIGPPSSRSGSLAPGPKPCRTSRVSSPRSTSA